MTSAERHEARYQRRAAKRQQRKSQRQKTLEEIFTPSNVIDAGRLCCNNSRWKTSTILFEANLLRHVCDIRKEVMSGVHRFNGFTSFTTIERGKTRMINAIKICDRVIQKCLVKYLLFPAVTPSFIYDNCACIPGKGHLFQLERLKKHLRDHYRKYGLEGGIYQFDFSGYFASIPHVAIKEHFKRYIEDKGAYELFCALIDDFQELKQETSSDSDDGEPRGIGLGSEVSQLIGLEYANSIDHFIKDEMGIHGYGRYNDDGYVISHDLQQLREISDAVNKMAVDLGIKINAKKNRITPFAHHSFTFLKIRIRLLPSGRISIKLPRVSIRRMRCKLKIFREWVDTGRFTFEDVAQSYQSWRGYARSRKAFSTVYNMDTLFLQLFEEELRSYPKKYICSHRAYYAEDGWHYVGIKEAHGG